MENNDTPFDLNEMKDHALSLQLIELVKTHPVLWSVSSKSNLHANKKVNAWRAIAEHMGKPEKMVIKKWQSLCAYLRKENTKIKKSMITGSGRSDVYKSKWFAFKSMQFIRNTAKARKTQSTLKRSRLQNHLPSPENNDADVILHQQQPPEQPETDVPVKQEQTSETNDTDVVLLHQPIPGNKDTEVASSTRKRKAQNNQDDEFSEIYTSIGQSLETIISNMNNYTSRNVTFGNYVTQTLEGLPKAKQEKLIHKINEYIYEIQNENDS